MRILVSNDDGVNAPGIHFLAQALQEFAHVTVVAPVANRSGASHCLTLELPLRVNTLDNGFMAVDGTPTDCVHLALSKLLPTPPDLVISGINAGPNLGDDVLYSGTVAAAMEGRFLDKAAIAVSLASRKPQHYITAARVTCELVKRLRHKPIEPEQVLNVNVPDLPYEALKGFKVTRLGRRHFPDSVQEMTDPKGNTVYWLGAPGDVADNSDGTDFAAIEAGYISVTPLTIDRTGYSQLANLNKWLEQNG